MNSGRASTGRGPAVRDVHERARRAIRLLVGRQAVLQLVGLGGGIVVARILGPTPLGVFGIALFLVNLAGLAAELGIRTALIRQPEAPTERQLATAFTLQLALATILAALLFLAAPAIARLYGRALPELPWLVRLLALDLYLRAWRSMSEVRLERELRYRELAISDIVGSTGYQAVAIGLVLAGWGAGGLVAATLFGGVLRNASLHHAAPWRVRLGFQPAAARALVRTGTALQAGRVVGLAPGWITPTLVAGLIGPEAVGLLTWAATIGRKPFELLENVIRVAQPHFARLQHDADEVEHTLERYVLLSLLLCGLWFAVLLVAGRDLVTLVFTAQWLPALPALLVYAASAALAAVRWLGAAALVGIGRIRFTLHVSIAASAIAIAASALLVVRLGAVGVPIGQLAGIAVATPWLLHGIRPGTASRTLRASLPVLAPVCVAIAAGTLAGLAPLAPGLRGLFTAGVTSAVYAAATWSAGPRWLRASVREDLALASVRLGRSAAR
jgi:PST family polysaccharide transporter